MMSVEILDEAKTDLCKVWGDNAEKVIKVCNEIETPFDGTFKEFLSHCTACGGNWGGMILSGIKELFPDVWDAIPDDMGCFAFQGLCCVLQLVGVDTAN